MPTSIRAEIGLGSILEDVSVPQIEYATKLPYCKLLYQLQKVDCHILRG